MSFDDKMAKGPPFWERGHGTGVEERLAEIGKILGENLPPDVGFAVLLFDRGPRGFMHYLSNCNRKDVIAALKELVALMEFEPAHRVPS